MILNGGTAVILAATLLQTPQQSSPTNDATSAVRRLAATSQLAAQEYRLGIDGGRIVSRAEVEEARLFLEEARRSAGALPARIGLEVRGQLDSVIHLVDAVANPDSVDARVLRLTTDLSNRLGITLDEVPGTAPSLARGAAVYRTNCAACHGTLGRGDGAAGSGLDPRPANLADSTGLADQTPLDYYRRITIGVVGTAMPGFEVRLSSHDRWAAALYASLLRLPPPSGDVPSGLQDFSKTANMSDMELALALKLNDHAGANAARIAAVRSFQPDASAGGEREVFARVRTQLDSTYALARVGGPAAGAQAVDAYMTFEQIERELRAKRPSLAAELEQSFSALRGAVAAGVNPAELGVIEQRLASGLEKAERALDEVPSQANLFFQSLVILVREGLEAILIVGALMTFLVKMGATQRRRDINLGVIAAIAASLITAFALETFFQLTQPKQEALEGVTMLLAAAVLFSVSYWLVSKMEVVKWNQFVKGKVHRALASGSSLALASAAFLAVYREGFETILFYKALFVSGSGAVVPILAGMLVGAVILAGLYLVISRFGVRLPLRPFFGVTSALLYYMAFVFAGKGVAELQEGGLLPITLVPGAPRLPALGIYPTVESLLAQGILIALLMAAVVWSFIIEPKRNATIEAPSQDERQLVS